MLRETISDVLFYGPWVITLAAGAATRLPPGRPGSPLAVIHSFINFLAFNWGYAENKAGYDADWDRSHEWDRHPGMRDWR